MTIAPVFVGIDVSKHHLDLFDDAERRHQRIDNAPAAIDGLLASLNGREVFVTFEATGRYDAALRRALSEAAIPFARVNPARARDFARAASQIAKTDAIDARMLADLGRCLRPEPRPEPAPERQALTIAHRRRDQLVQARQKERTRLAEGHGPLLEADIRAHIAWLDEAIARWDKEIARLIASQPDLERAARQLRTIPGFGPVSVVTLLALMPELGTLSAKPIAALAGLAPFNVDSGQFRGTRRIQGGRKRIRDALYMAAVTAAHRHPRFKAFYQTLRDAGKPPKLALIAVARKLLVTANAIIRNDTVFQT